MFELTWI